LKKRRTTKFEGLHQTAVIISEMEFGEEIPLETVKEIFRRLKIVIKNLKQKDMIELVEKLISPS
jgi:hypothetical protein